MRTLVRPGKYTQMHTVDSPAIEQVWVALDALSDLSDGELSRLLAAAELDTRELLGAMGYFSPEVHLAQRTAADSPVSSHGAD